MYWHLQTEKGARPIVLAGLVLASLIAAAVAPGEEQGRSEESVRGESFEEWVVEIVTLFDVSQEVDVKRMRARVRRLPRMDLTEQQSRLAAMLLCQVLTREEELRYPPSRAVWAMSPLYHLRCAVCEALAGLGEVAAVPHLQRFYRQQAAHAGGESVEYIAAAIRALGGKVPLIERQPEELHWPGESVLSAEELRHLRAQLILQHLHEEDWDTTAFHTKSAQAIHELGELRAQEAVPYLLEQLDQEKPYIVRERAISALGTIGDPRAIEPLLRFLRNDEVPGNPEDSAVLRGHAIRALAHLQAKAALPDIKACLKDPAAYVRWRAAEAVADLGEEADLQALEELRNDEDESVRQVVKVLLEGRAEPSTEQ